MPWVICCNCEGEGKHSQGMGSFTSSEFHEHFDTEEDREGYFAGAYDCRCEPCGGSGKLRVEEDGELSEDAQIALEDQRNRNCIAETGRNSAGEPCW